MNPTRPVGRPPLPEDERRRRLDLRLKPDAWAELATLAKRMKWTRSAVVEWLVDGHP